MTMNYTAKKENGKAKIEFEITAKEWQDELTATYLRLRGKFAIPGFRKGHAPRGVIERMYGKHVFDEDAYETVFAGAYYEAIQKEEWIIPVDSPKVEIGENNSEKVTFSATVTLKPEIALGAYKGLEIEKAEAEVTDAEVDREVEHRRNQLTRLLQVTDRPVKEGDVATIDYLGKVDGVPFEGGTAEKYALEIGSNSFIPGFESQVVGMNVGETKDIAVKFPSDYHAEGLKGKDAVFTVTVHEITSKELPALDDAFACDATTSHAETLAELKDEIRAELKEDKTRRSEIAADNALIDAICKGFEVEIPKCMTDKELDYIVSDFEMQVHEQYGVKFEDYMRYMGMKISDFRSSRESQAKTNVKTRLALEKIIELEKIEVNEKEVDAEIEKRAAAAKAEAREKGVSYVEPDINEARRYTHSDLLMEKLMEFLRKNNKFIAKKSDDDKPAKKPAAKKAASAEKPETENKPEEKAEKKTAAKSAGKAKTDDKK